MKKTTTLILLIISLVFGLQAQNPDSLTINPNAKTGWKFGGAVPAVAYDSDIGFKYGALGYVYDYGDGTSYPDYVRSIYAEWSNTTKGSMINMFQYDDRAFLGSKTRFFFDLSYLIEQSLDFYGYNGYEAVYNPAFETDSSRMYYRLDRRNLRSFIDFQFPLIGNKLRAYAGVNITNMQIGSVNISKLNKGKDPADLLPSQDTLPGLYENYVNWGIIQENEATGGFTSILKAGLIVDTRNNEAQATKGVWTEAFIYGSPGFGGTSPFLQATLTHRQYFQILPRKRLSFAYRLVAQGTLAGEVPFYLRSFYFNTKEMRDGIGGSKTVRGVLRNKVVADSYAFGNAELRFRVLDTRIFNQDFYVALSGFTDVAQVLIPYEVDLSQLTEAEKNTHFNTNKEDLYRPHIGYGGGLRLGLNENFIVAVDYGMAHDKQDGTSGLYIALGWLF